MNQLYEEARRIIKKARCDIEVMRFDKKTQEAIFLINNYTRKLCSNENGSLHEKYGGENR